VSSTLIEPRYYHQDLQVPAGTQPAFAVTVDSPTPNVQLDSVIVRVPPGCAGLVGFMVVLSQEAIIPYGSPPTWTIADDETVVLQAGYVVDGTLVFAAYNLDVYPHTLHLDWVAEDSSGGSGTTTAAAVTSTPVTPGGLPLVGAPLMPAPVST
jgi:hypothetical protein